MKYEKCMGILGGHVWSYLGFFVSLGQFGSLMVHGQKLCMKSVQKSKDEEKTLNQNIYIDTSFKKEYFHTVQPKNVDWCECEKCHL